ncbi:MAG TPA: helix-turn-helix domain-containing protein [Saprospiraceae bacterium]|nr:helix-turn-helix domain-containing protein [Saprospiraceae bacterium]
MNFQREDNPDWLDLIDCYWESHDMNGHEKYIYPSLPEPYINIYFPISSEEGATLKGISSQTDFFEMKAKLFGVRLFLKGYYYLQLEDCAKVSNQIVYLEDVGKQVETKLSCEISQSKNFQDRVSLFKDYFQEKGKYTLNRKESNISAAFQYLGNNYRNPQVIKNYAEIAGFSSRTINRWFSTDIGIPPKKLSKIFRFHKALGKLHLQRDRSFYLDLGYYDQSHFIRDFKEYTGVSPEKYLEIVSDLYNTG